MVHSMRVGYQTSYASSSQPWLHNRITWGVLNCPYAQAMPHTNEIRTLEMGHRHEKNFKLPDINMLPKIENHCPSPQQQLRQGLWGDMPGDISKGKQWTATQKEAQEESLCKNHPSSQ